MKNSRLAVINLKNNITRLCDIQQEAICFRVLHVINLKKQC